MKCQRRGPKEKLSFRLPRGIAVGLEALAAARYGGNASRAAVAALEAGLSALAVPIDQMLPSPELDSEPRHSL